MKPARTFSKDPNKAMQEMMETIDTLRDVYVRENAALDNADTQAFLELQEKKLETARDYQNGIENILSRKDQMKNTNPLLRKRLVEMQKGFSELTTKNLESLKRMQRSTHRLGELLMNAAKESAKSQRSHVYGETGAIRGADRKSVSMGLSETA
jgi:hypothetical protein